jgi:alkylation response protein AidB-like acyl-CoA dehydrogenase
VTTEPALAVTTPDRLRAQAQEAAGEVTAAIEFGAGVSGRVMAGRPGRLPLMSDAIALLAAIAEGSAMTARVTEPQLDARMILAECPHEVALDAVSAGEHSTWGVFAAEAPGSVLEAREADGGWQLTGTKPWCSLADRLSHALVTAHTADGRRLFAVDLRAGVTAHPETWAARGLPAVTSGPADFDAVRAVPVGAAGWYLERPGFEWGGIRVAACWYGAARGVASSVRRAAQEHDSEIVWMHAGRIEARLHSARLALDDAARAVDGATPAATPARLAQLTRTIVRGACDDILREADHALGPAPAALDPWYAAQTSDLALYLLQDHAERDEARLGRLSAEPGWL